VHNRTNDSYRQQPKTRRIGAKQLAHALGRPLKQTRRMLRNKVGGHQSWKMWLFTEEEAAAIVAVYKRERLQREQR
jgi:hypothetical protein